MARITRRPAAAFGLSLVGGIIILATGILFTVVGALITLPIGGAGGIFGLFGAIWGILVIASSMMLFNRPGEKLLWSALIIIFSLLSLFGAFGGFIIGMVLGIAGGILGLIWNPDS